MMRIYGSSLLMVFISSYLSAQCPDVSVVLQSQEDVDEFAFMYPTCTALTGDLFIIGDGEVASDITNLSGLTNVASIGGTLVISNNHVLSTLAGLNNLTSIGSGLIIEDNASLSSLSGLDNLVSVGQEVQISNNTILEALNALAELTSIGGRLLVADNPILASLDGLEGLSSIGADMTLALNASLTSLAGLENLSSIGGSLVITDHAALSSLDGLTGLSSINGFFQLTYNHTLASLSGIDNIETSTISQLFIESNAELANCAAQSICSFLTTEADMAYIGNNASGCDNTMEVIAACTTVTATDVEWKNIELYPNPTTGWLRIDNVAVERIDVFSPQGQRVAHQQMPGKELSLNTLPAGVYYLHVLTVNEKYIARVVKK